MHQVSDSDDGVIGSACHAPITPSSSGLFPGRQWAAGSRRAVVPIAQAYGGGVPLVR